MKADRMKIADFCLELPNLTLLHEHIRFHNGHLLCKEIIF